MRLLALDAALGPCSAALLDGGICVAHACRDGRAALADLAVMVEGLLAAAPGGLDAVAVTVGPGSFTGLRAALGLAHGLALGAGVPVIGVTVAEAFAYSADAGSRSLWVAIDTRRGRVFLARDGGDFETVAVDALPRPFGAVTVAGDAADGVAAHLCAMGVDAVAKSARRIDPMDVAAVGLAHLAGTLPPCDPQPLYVDPPEARQAALLRPAPE